MKHLLVYLLLVIIVGVISTNYNSDHTLNHSIEKASTSTGDFLTTLVEDTTYEIVKSEEEWRKQLSSSEYRILRNRGTELPYVNEYYKNSREGVYYCGACGQAIFTSETKYKSGTGWPSFWKPITSNAVGEKEDNSFFMTRTEVVCSRCGSHLGHVFKDGPDPTGLRYCLNSAALDFVEMNLSEVDIKNLPVKE